MAKKERVQAQRMLETAVSRMPDLAARQPAEGDLRQIDGTPHLCCPDGPISSSLPVESGALAEEEPHE
ncbi:MAG TPA: hypothetical protein GX715_18225 [Armatimonadetes bacterium]|jgi:hypothetical protein|nr:hypothetical protein [Armatimonadota bacterium]